MVGQNWYMKGIVLAILTFSLLRTSNFYAKTSTANYSWNGTFKYQLGAPTPITPPLPLGVMKMWFLRPHRYQVVDVNFTASTVSARHRVVIIGAYVQLNTS